VLIPGCSPSRPQQGQPAPALELTGEVGRGLTVGAASLR